MLGQAEEMNESLGTFSHVNIGDGWRNMTP